ncbi:MAG: hypothetical protein R3F11_14490 [Verrucomicrobiales bacterium]
MRSSCYSCRWLVGFGYRALVGGRWRDWIGFAAAHFGILYAFPGAIIFAALRRASRRRLEPVARVAGRCRRLAGRRAGIARPARRRGFCAALLYAQLTLPNAIQIREHIGDALHQGPLDAAWGLLAWDEYFAGIRLPVPEQVEAIRSGALSLSGCLGGMFRADAPGVLFAFAIAPAACALGLWRLIRDPQLRPIAAAGALAPWLSLLHHGVFTGFYIFYWYLIYALPFLIIFACAALPDEAKSGRNPRLPMVAAAAAVAAFALVSLPFFGRQGRDHIALYPEPAKAPVEFVRGHSRWIVFLDGHMERVPL